jgi:hypothetical protein
VKGEFVKHFKKLFLAFAVVTLLAVPCVADDEVMNADFNIAPPVGGDNSGNGNCLSSYNTCLYNCDARTAGATRMGCKVDCWFDYYGCIGNSAFG